MRNLLQLCVEMDTIAKDRYSRMASTCEDANLGEVFARMSAEESQHIGWWSDLMTAWDEGLIPDIVNDTDSVAQHMRNLMVQLRDSAHDESIAGLSSDEMLDIAARTEFFMLDPVFGELIDLMEPGGSKEHKEAYSRHLDRVVGAIEMFHSRKEYARFLASVLQRAWRDNLALASFSSRDPLTGLYNRRGMLAHLRQWVSWAQRYDRPLSVILVDVDDFKLTNDANGHTVGDLCLRTIADSLRSAVRHSDLVARYGGDEFAIIAPETDVDELERLLDRIVSAVRETDLKDWDGIPITLTVSAGGATARGHLLLEPDVDGILAAADRGLYTSKTLGKNRYTTPTVLGEETVAN